MTLMTPSIPQTFVFYSAAIEPIVTKLDQKLLYFDTFGRIVYLVPLSGDLERKRNEDSLQDKGSQVYILENNCI